MSETEPEQNQVLVDLLGAQNRIDAFCKEWCRPLMERCGTNNQKLAAWWLWVRFLLALRSMRYLWEADDISGCYTIARCCQEYDVAIDAIADDPLLGDRYVDYDVHAKNRHLRARKLTEPDPDLRGLEHYLETQFGADFATKKDTNWHAGFRNLCEATKREDELPTYLALCQVLHGTVTGMYMLDAVVRHSKDEIRRSASTVLATYTRRYLEASRCVVELVYGTLWTPEKHKCIDGLDRLTVSITGPPEGYEVQ